MSFPALVRRADLTGFSPSVDLYYVADRAGLGDRHPDWLVGWMAALVAGHGFPPPLPCGERGGVHLLSRWRRIEADRWLAGGFPPLAHPVAARNRTGRATPRAARPLPAVRPPLDGPGAAA